MTKLHPVHVCVTSLCHSVFHFIVSLFLSLHSVLPCATASYPQHRTLFAKEPYKRDYILQKRPILSPHLILPLLWCDSWVNCVSLCLTIHCVTLSVTSFCPPVCHRIPSLALSLHFSLPLLWCDCWVSCVPLHSVCHFIVSLCFSIHCVTPSVTSFCPPMCHCILWGGYD